MCRIVEEIVEKEVAAAKAEGEAKGKAAAKHDSAVRMLKKRQYSIREIADILDLDPKAVEEISKQITH